MNSTYDFESARNTLEQRASISKGPEDRSLANVAKKLNWTNQLRIDCLQEPKTWRLLMAQNEGGELNTVEEAIFAIQGVVSAKDLPPFREKPSCPAVKYRYLRQGITITGIGSPTFDCAMDAATEISRIFDRQFVEGQMSPWVPSTVAGTEYCSIDLSNRYLTPKKDAPNMVHIPFTPAEDPRGILEGMAGSGYVRGEENVVGYYKCSQDGGEERFQVAEPQIFRVGDIVEAQVSFAVVPLKANKYKMLNILRSIALLDGQFAQKQGVKRGEIPVQANIKLKRRVGYNVGGEGSGEKKANMEVDHDGTGLD